MDKAFLATPADYNTIENMVARQAERELSDDLQQAANEFSRAVGYTYEIPISELLNGRERIGLGALLVLLCRHMAKELRDERVAAARQDFIAKVNNTTQLPALRDGAKSPSLRKSRV